MIHRYWVYLYLNGKYWRRSDIHKILYVQNVLYQSHVTLLRFLYPDLAWSRWEAKDLGLMPKKHRDELLIYYRGPSMDSVYEVLKHEMDLFSAHAQEACKRWKPTYPEDLETAVRKHLRKLIRANETMGKTHLAHKALMRHRPFAYAYVFQHEAGLASKNESNCTVFLKDGTWFTTWGQGLHEGAPNESIVYATSRNMGRTWSAPAVIQSSVPELEEHIAYGIPFVVPNTGRIYVFFFVQTNTEGKLWVATGTLDHRKRRYPEHGTGTLHFIYSDDNGQTWSQRYPIALPDRDINQIPGRIHGWVNHPPQLIPTGEVILTFGGAYRNVRVWQLGAAEINVVHCENILSEQDPSKLVFTMYPEGPRGIRVDVFRHRNNRSLNQLLDFFDGAPEDTGYNFQEMTVIHLSGDRWLGVGRCNLGAPTYTLSTDRGKTWTSPEPLCYTPGGELIKHPMTMCPIAKTSDGRIVLLFTNNDGFQRGARHVWDGDGRTRNPQWIVVGREVPGESRNAGLFFGEPVILAEVDDSGETNLKTGISMPQFFERKGRYFVCYNVNKLDILLDEIPKEVLDKLTPKVA